MPDYVINNLSLIDILLGGNDVITLGIYINLILAVVLLLLQLVLRIRDGVIESDSESGSGFAVVVR